MRHFLSVTISYATFRILYFHIHILSLSLWFPSSHSVFCIQTSLVQKELPYSCSWLSSLYLLAILEIFFFISNRYRLGLKRRFLFLLIFFSRIVLDYIKVQSIQDLPSLQHSAGYIINSSQALGTNVHNSLGSTSPLTTSIFVSYHRFCLWSAFSTNILRAIEALVFTFQTLLTCSFFFHFPTPVTSKSAFLTQPQIILLSCLFFSMSLMYLRLKSLSHKLKELV